VDFWEPADPGWGVDDGCGLSEGGTKYRLLFSTGAGGGFCFDLGMISASSLSGSVIRAVMRAWACLVASADPLQ